MSYIWQIRFFPKFGKFDFFPRLVDYNLAVDTLREQYYGNTFKLVILSSIH